MQFRVKFWSELHALLRFNSPRLLFASTFCTFLLSFSQILHDDKSIMTRRCEARPSPPSPQAGLYITKPGRWIYSWSLHLRFAILPVAYIWAVYIRWTEREQRSFSTWQKLGHIVWSGSIEDASKLESKSNLLPHLGYASSLPIGGWSTLCTPLLLTIWSRSDVIDFNRTVHSPLNNARRSTDLEIIECPRHLSPPRTHLVRLNHRRILMILLTHRILLNFANE